MHAPLAWHGAVRSEGFVGSLSTLDEMVDGVEGCGTNITNVAEAEDHPPRILEHKLTGLH